MELLDIVALALIQGITEFLPISSSGHLALWPILTGRPDQGVTMDVAVHLGTLVAVCLFFRREAGAVLTGLKHVLTGEMGSNEARGFLLVCVATAPVVLAGLFLKVTGWVDALRALEVVGWATLLGGLLLWAADRFGLRLRSFRGWNLNDAHMMGLAQVLALIPGTSRSGITMTMARILGFDRTDAARLSMIMAMPVILAAGTLETYGVIREGNLAITAELGLGAVLSFLAALAALNVMMRMFSREWTMLPFVLYRLALGTVLLAIAYL
jgi:undecaprenyl-diphosphatase